MENPGLWYNPLKEKRDSLAFENYIGVRLLEHGIKQWEKVLESRLKKIFKLDKGHFDFIEINSTFDAILIIRKMKEMYQLKKKL